MKRIDGRSPFDLRPIVITRNFLKFAEGSVQIAMGDTKVICTATVEERVPPFLAGTGKGWLTAEYSMIPRSSQTRIPRESAKGKLGGRTHEIQRLIGRSLRAVVDLNALGSRTITVDCDVIQADGGTRTASITGAYIAVADALAKLRETGIVGNLLLDSVAAVSVGVIRSVPCVDLNYEEDSSAEVDMNVVMTGSGKFIEVQGTAESNPFSGDALSGMIGLASTAIKEITKMQSDLLSVQS